RHTRFSRDWSSDVCYSDLGTRNWEIMICCLEQLFVTRIMMIIPRLPTIKILLRCLEFLPKTKFPLIINTVFCWVHGMIITTITDLFLHRVLLIGTNQKKEMCCD